MNSSQFTFDGIPFIFSEGLVQLISVIKNIKLEYILVLFDKESKQIPLTLNDVAFLIRNNFSNETPSKKFIMCANIFKHRDGKLIFTKVVNSDNKAKGKAHKNIFLESLNYMSIDVEKEYNDRVVSLEIMRPEELGLFIRPNHSLSMFMDPNLIQYLTDQGSIVRLDKNVLKHIPAKGSVYLQEKMDGVRLFIKLELISTEINEIDADSFDFNVLFQTRKGKELVYHPSCLALRDIVSDLKKIAMCTKQRVITFDGELYSSLSFIDINRLSAYLIGSNIEEANKVYNSAKFNYYVFDIIDHSNLEQTLDKRVEFMQELSLKLVSNNSLNVIKFLNYFELKFSGFDSLMISLVNIMHTQKLRPLCKRIEFNGSQKDEDFIAKQFEKEPEGVVIKMTDMPYERSSNRSRRILKLKYCSTESFMLKSIDRTKNGGLSCKFTTMINDKVEYFHSTMNLPHDQQEYLYNNQSTVIGKYYEVQFIARTEYGTPLFSKTMLIERTDEYLS
jgi:hypothetical protein